MKRFLVILLALTMVVLPVSVFGAYDDTDGHWAEDSIARWSGYGIVEGFDGLFNPDHPMTRAEAAAVFARLLNLEAKADISGFGDVAADAWYADVIAQCVAAGIMNGTADDKMSPEDTLSREQMMVMMCRALGIEPQATCDKDFDDAHEVSDWAEGYINALVNMDIVHGMTEDTLEPEQDMNRASMMALLDKAILAYGDSEGTTLDITGGGTGVVLIVANNVKVENAPAGTVVVTGQETDGTTVNGSAVKEDDVHVVPEANKPAVGGGGGSYTPVVPPQDPTQPTQPTAPTQPTNPTTPVVPTTPTNPTTPVVPTTPTQPTTPVVPTTPANPTIQDTPEQDAPLS